MVSEEDKNLISRLAKKYGVTTLFLFGSSTEKEGEACDIDIGIQGIEPKLFFKFYGELTRHLPKPVDVVDVSRPSLFNQLIQKNGVKIYG
jgi:predicted nucleotidyltransferase